jgi:hypothetical protein
MAQAHHPNAVGNVVPLWSGVTNTPTILASNVTFYLDPTGSDTVNTGLSAGSPWATVDRVLLALSAYTRIEGKIRVNLAAGTYAWPSAVDGSRFAGGGSLGFVGARTVLKSGTLAGGTTTTSLVSTGLGTNTYQGKWIRLTGSDQTVQIQQHTATTMIPVVALTGAANGVAYEIYEPSVKFTLFSATLTSVLHDFVGAWPNAENNSVLVAFVDCAFMGAGNLLVQNCNFYCKSLQLKISGSAPLFRARGGLILLGRSVTVDTLTSASSTYAWLGAANDTVWVGAGLLSEGTAFMSWGASCITLGFLVAFGGLGPNSALGFSRAGSCFLFGGALTAVGTSPAFVATGGDNTIQATPPFVIYGPTSTVQAALVELDANLTINGLTLDAAATCTEVVRATGRGLLIIGGTLVGAGTIYGSRSLDGGRISYTTLPTFTGGTADLALRSATAANASLNDTVGNVIERIS